MRRWWDEAGSGDGGGKVWVGCGWSLAVCGASGGACAGACAGWLAEELLLSQPLSVGVSSK